MFDVNTALKIPLGFEDIQADHSSGKARASKRDSC